MMSIYHRLFSSAVQREFVSSSNLLSIAYDKDKKMLEVAFKNGSLYQYMEVPEQLYLALMSAPSKGKFFNSYIKNNYNTVRVY